MKSEKVKTDMTSGPCSTGKRTSVQKSGLALTLFLSIGRYREAEGTTFLISPGLDPDVPTVAFYNLLADGQANAGARNFAEGVKPLEDLKYFLMMLLASPDAIIRISLWGRDWASGRA